MFGFVGILEYGAAGFGLPGGPLADLSLSHPGTFVRIWHVGKDGTMAIAYDRVRPGAGSTSPQDRPGRSEGRPGGNLLKEELADDR